MANETPRAVNARAVNTLERQQQYAREPRHTHWQPGGVRQPYNLADPGRLAKKHREALKPVREK